MSWRRTKLEFKSFAEEIQKETRKDIKQEDIQPGSEYLRFQRDILRVLNVYTMKLNQTLNTAFETAKFIVLSKKGKKMCALHRVFPTLSIIVLISCRFRISNLFCWLNFRYEGLVRSIFQKVIQAKSLKDSSQLKSCWKKGARKNTE